MPRFLSITLAVCAVVLTAAIVLRLARPSGSEVAREVAAISKAVATPSVFGKWLLQSKGDETLASIWDFQETGTVRVNGLSLQFTIMGDTVFVAGGTSGGVLRLLISGDSSMSMIGNPGAVLRRGK